VKGTLGSESEVWQHGRLVVVVVRGRVRRGDTGKVQGMGMVVAVGGRRFEHHLSIIRYTLTTHIRTPSPTTHNLAPTSPTIHTHTIRINEPLCLRFPKHSYNPRLTLQDTISHLISFSTQHTRANEDQTQLNHPSSGLQDQGIHLMPGGRGDEVKMENNLTSQTAAEPLGL
jgi:hypothetical protein